VSAFKRDLQRVLADQRYVVDSQLVIGKALDAAQPARRARLAAALGARTCPPQPVGRVAAVMPVLPGDLHHLNGSIHIDVDRERVWVFQRTLITGSWRNDWIDVRADTCEAISTNALAPADSGREMTTGVPLSASSRIPSSSGTAPRKGTPSR